MSQCLLLDKRRKKNSSTQRGNIETIYKLYKVDELFVKQSSMNSGQGDPGTCVLWVNIFFCPVTLPRYTSFFS